jgi:hypothetical protein
MSLTIRRVSAIEHRQEVVGLLQRNLGASQQQRIDWRHTLNPAGPSWSWFLYDRDHHEPVAMASVFPRHMWAGGKPVLGGQVGSFVVDAGHRSLGPALLLQRATFEPVDSGTLAFCFDCPPHDQGMSTFVRLGMQVNAKIVRYTRLLRTEPFVEKRFGRGVWTKPVVAAGNLILRRRFANPHVAGLEICSYGGVFGEEFSCLDKRLSNSDVIRASRSAQDLNWRYRDDPLAAECLPNGNTGRYRILLARVAGELLGFAAIFVQSDGIASIVDLFGDRLPDVGAALLEAVIEMCRRLNLHAVHGFCSEGSELNQLFKRAGLRARETAARVVAYEKSTDATARILRPDLRWAFSQVDLLV